MSIKEPVVKKSELKFSKTGSFSLTDFYQTAKAWFKDNGYTFLEKEYEDVILDNKKTTKISWECSKELDDYSKSIIEVSITIKDYSFVKKDNKRLIKGKLEVEFVSKLETDYENKWEKDPFKQLMRGIQQKFVISNRMKSYKDEIKQDTHELFSRIKSYLNSIILK